MHAARSAPAMELAIAVHGPQERLPIAPDTEEQLYLLVRFSRRRRTRSQRAHATAAAIDVTATDYAVAIEVGDNGRGFAHAHARAESFGLRSMHSRAAEFGGRLEITSAPSRGTVVRVAVPAPTAAARVSCVAGRVIGAPAHARIVEPERAAYVAARHHRIRVSCATAFVESRAPASSPSRRVAGHAFSHTRAGAPAGHLFGAA